MHSVLLLINSLVAAVMVAVSIPGASAQDWSHDGVEFYPEWVAKFAAAHDHCLPLVGKPDIIFESEVNPNIPAWMKDFSLQYRSEAYRKTLSINERRLLVRQYESGLDMADTIGCWNIIPDLETAYLETLVELEDQRPWFSDSTGEDRRKSWRNKNTGSVWDLGDEEIDAELVIGLVSSLVFALLIIDFVRRMAVARGRNPLLWGVLCILITPFIVVPALLILGRKSKSP